MPTKKSSSVKTKSYAKEQSDSLSVISWLRWTYNLKWKPLIAGVTLVSLLAYGGLIAMRISNDYICFDWPWTSHSKLYANNLTINIPDGWQRYYCSGGNWGESVTLKDTITSNWSKILLVMGWGGYEYYMSPGESGNIEINTSLKKTSLYKGKSLDEVYSAQSAQKLPEWVKADYKKLSIDGRKAIQVVNYNNPDPSMKQRDWRYQYYNSIFFFEGEYWYELRLHGDWYKAESRDAWVAKYEPLFDQMVKSAAFK